MTLTQLEDALDQRDAVLQVLRSPGKWTVLLYAPEDPEATLHSASALRLDTAVSSVFAAWDGEVPK